MRLHHPVGDGELELVDPKPARNVVRRKAVLLAQEQQDVGGLADDQLPGLEVGRCEGRVRPLGGEVQAEQAIPLARWFGVGDAGGLKGEADELAAAGDAVPVPKLVRYHRPPDTVTIVPVT